MGAKLEITTTRDVTHEEIESMIFGTGALVWEWWRDVTPEGDAAWRVRSEQNPAGTVVRDDVIAYQAGKWLSTQTRTGDIRDAINEDLGYLDASAADCVLQLAAFGEIIYA